MPSSVSANPETAHDPTQEVSPFVYGSPLCQDLESTIFPFTTALPLDAQQILAGSNFDYGDPAFGMFMSGSDVDFTQNDVTTSDDEKTQQDEANDEQQFGAFWNDVILGV